MRLIDEKDYMLLKRVPAAIDELTNAQTFLALHDADEAEINAAAVCVSSALDLLKDGGKYGHATEAL